MGDIEDLRTSVSICRISAWPSANHRRRHVAFHAHSMRGLPRTLHAQQDTSPPQQYLFFRYLLVQALSSTVYTSSQILVYSSVSSPSPRHGAFQALSINRPTISCNNRTRESSTIIAINPSPMHAVRVERWTFGIPRQAPRMQPPHL